MTGFKGCSPGLVGGGIGLAGLTGSSHGLIAKANKSYLVSIFCQYNCSFGRMLRGELGLIVAPEAIPIQPRVALGRHLSTTTSPRIPLWKSQLNSQ
jgi:hypothetical protein